MPTEGPIIRVEELSICLYHFISSPRTCLFTLLGWCDQFHFGFCFPWVFQMIASKSRRGAVFHRLRGTEVAKVTIVTIAAPVLLSWSVPDGFHGKVGWKLWKIGKGNHSLAIILTSRIVSWNKQVRLLQGLALKVEVAPLAYRGMILQPCNWYGHDWGSTVPNWDEPSTAFRPQVPLGAPLWNKNMNMACNCRTGAPKGSAPSWSKGLPVWPQECNLAMSWHQ